MLSIRPIDPHPWRRGFSLGVRAPYQAQHCPQPGPLCTSSSRDPARSPRETRSGPWKPLNPSPITDKMPPSPQSLTHPGNPFTHPLNVGNPHPQPKRWSPSRGFHPGSPTGVISASQEASPPPPTRRSGREPPQLRQSPRPGAGSPAAPPAPRAGRPPPRAESQRRNKAESASRPRQDSRQLGSLVSQRKASGKSWAPSPQAPGQTPQT